MSNQGKPEIGSPEWIEQRQARREKVTQACQRLLTLFQIGKLTWEVRSFSFPLGTQYTCITEFQGHKIKLEVLDIPTFPGGWKTTLHFFDRDKHFYNDIPELQILGKQVAESGGNVRTIDSVLDELITF
jgi:hypothetical protein